MIYTCCDRERREAVRAHQRLNGIDYLEVLDRGVPVAPRQRTLLVRMLKPPPGLTPDNLRITGGLREPEVRVQWVAVASSFKTLPIRRPDHEFFANLPDADRVLVVRTASTGDFSRYTLRLVTSSTNEDPPAPFDSLLAAVEFSFKVECESDFDCLERRVCPPAPRLPKDIDYLAKDYVSFRRLILDRLRQLVPGWRERSAADPAVVLAELLAYVGDHLSYWQDAVATEAYLGTARRRISLRRHALLVDYHVHEGCNARAWVCVEVDAPFQLLAAQDLRENGVQFVTRVPRLGARVTALPEPRPGTLGHAFEVFEPLHDAELRPEHNRMSFYSWTYTDSTSNQTWSDRRCCLSQGATRATLAGHFPHLERGDVLIFEEAKGPETGNESDRDPDHRHPVRLSDVRHTAAGRPLRDPLTGAEITEIRWHEADALPWPLCISWRVGEGAGAQDISDVSVARGNVVLVDHGSRVTGEDLGTVPKPDPRLAHAPSADADPCGSRKRTPLAARFRPPLAQRPLTRQVHVDRRTVNGGGARIERVLLDPDGPARDAISSQPPRAVPCIQLDGALGGETQPWTPEADLLSSRSSDRHFVVEAEHDGTAHLRFGDDRHGDRPEAGTQFTAHYRVGNGISGNVGAEVIAHVVTDQDGIVRVRNPLPARGGAEAESVEQVRRRAPQAFRTQERAVTLEDYAQKTELLPEVQRAAAVLRWTGSWHTVFVAVDARAGKTVQPEVLVNHLERYRMAGQDLNGLPTRYVPLEVEMLVCVQAGYLRSEVRVGLLQELGSRSLADGRRGAFHPDNFTFGQPVYLSPLYAAARAVPGVASVQITTFQRLDVPETKYLDEGVLQVGPLEIPRLDNDPSVPDNGVLRFDLRGGQ